MQKKNIFYIALIVIYLLFLCKDSLALLSFNIPKLDSVKDSYYENEYNKLQKLFNIPYDNYNITYSKIIKRDIYDFFDVVTINKGKKDNINKGDVVVNDLGVIGVVSAVKNNFSEVNLLTNKKTSLSVKINDSYGILTSEDNKIIIKNIKLGKEFNEQKKKTTNADA